MNQHSADSPYPPPDTRQALSAERDGCLGRRPAEGLQRSQGSADGGQVQPDAHASEGPPTCNTGVGSSNRPSNGAKSAVYGWDWSATTHDTREDVVRDLLTAMGAKVALPGKGLQGWSTSVQGFDRDGHAIGSVYFGGGRQDVHVVSTSAAADVARRAVIGMDRARTSRVDTRVDTLAPFEELVEILEASGAQYGSRLTFMSSKVCKGDSLGRTVYLGSPKSAVRVRLYEKWLESPGQYVDGTNRVEVQLRPPSKVKERVSSWSAAETFCASRVTRDLARRLGTDMAEGSTLHVRRGTPDLERTVAVMGEQYGPAVARWLDFSGGDVGLVLDALGLGAA